MKLLATPSQFSSTIKRLIKKCDRIRGAVAWASADFQLCDVLKEYEHKITQLVVGTHFYQTAPNFIEAFLHNDNVRFVLKTDGVFHPKVYLFEHGDGTWECVVGSANFTKAAATKNMEVATLISSNEAGVIFADELFSTLNQFFDYGESVNEEWLRCYRQQWKRNQKRVEVLSDDFGETKGKKSILQTELLMMEWPEYYDSVKYDEIHSVDSRLTLLEKSCELFSRHGSFGAIPEEGRLGIAGLITTDEIDWKMFGYMGGKGEFQQHVKQPNPGISDALEEIPLTGDVSKRHFDKFRGEIEQAFDWHPNAIATRLLAMKRPDYFVCLDKKNKELLCKQLGIKKSISLEEYWELIVERILRSNWWLTPEPLDENERRIWNCRAAFLDVRCFKWE